MKYNNYSLDGISQKALNELPTILDEMGYSGRYTISGTFIRINGMRTTVSKAVHEAEKRAQGEDGYLIAIRQTSYASLWVPKSEAASLKNAYRVALNAAENGYPVENDPEFAIGSVEGGGFVESWQLDYMPD